MKLLHKEDSKLWFQYRLHWWFYKHQNHNQSHSNSEDLHVNRFTSTSTVRFEKWCVCVCARARAHVNNVVNTFLQKKKSDEVRSRDPIIGSWLIIVLTCAEWPEFQTEIRYVTIRNFDTSLCSTNFTVISFISWKQIFKCTDHIYRY